MPLEPVGRILKVIGESITAGAKTIGALGKFLVQCRSGEGNSRVRMARAKAVLDETVKSIWNRVAETSLPPQRRLALRQQSEAQIRTQRLVHTMDDLEQKINALQDNINNFNSKACPAFNRQDETINLQTVQETRASLFQDQAQLSQDMETLGILERNISAAYARIIGFEAELQKNRLQNYAESVEKRLNTSQSFIDKESWNSRQEDMKLIKDEIEALKTSFSENESITNLRQYSRNTADIVEMLNDSLADIVPNPTFKSAMNQNITQSLNKAFEAFSLNRECSLANPGTLVTDFVNHLATNSPNLLLKLKFMRPGSEGIINFVSTSFPDAENRDRTQFAMALSDRIQAQSNFAYIDKKTIRDNQQEYKFQRVLGSGGYANVCLFQSNTGSKLAVKIPTGGRSRMMFKEASVHCQAMGETGHPNIIGLQGIAPALPLPYMVMEYADGPDLGKLAFRLNRAQNEGKISHTEHIAIIQYLLRGAMDGMIHCQKNGVLHLDLKPENILYDRQSKQPKITDFGVSKIGLSMPHPGKPTGSPHYVSPETWGDDGYDGEKKTTEKADVWSLGIIAHELITNTKPSFYDPLPNVNVSPTQLWFQHNAKKLVEYGRQGDPSTVRQPVTAFAKLVTAMLDPDPRNRPSLGTLRQMEFFTDPMHDDDKVQELLNTIL